MKLVPPLPPEDPVTSWSNVPDPRPFGLEHLLEAIRRLEVAIERDNSDLGRQERKNGTVKPRPLP